MGALVTRRRFIAGSLVAAAALATGGMLVRLEQAAPGARVLSDHELKVVAAVSLVLFPGAPMPLDGVQAGVPILVDGLLADLLEAPKRMGFRYVLRALEVGTQASRGRRFTALPPAEQAEVLEIWSDPAVMPRRLGVDVLKVFLGMAYFQHPDIRAHLRWRTGCGGGAA